MSHDQRPGRMRVVAGQTAAATSQPGVPAIRDASAAAGEAGAPADDPARAKRGIGLIPAAIFLLACGGGGALVAYLRGAGIL